MVLFNPQLGWVGDKLLQTILKGISLKENISVDRSLNSLTTMLQSSIWTMMSRGLPYPYDIYEMIDCGESNKMIEICGKLDKSNT